MNGRKAYHRGQVTASPPKEQRDCCLAKRDNLGRLPVGRCGPDCLGHPANWLAHLKAQARAL